MTKLIFDTPWWLPTMLALAGITLLISGNRRQDKTLMRVGLIGLLFGGLLGGVSYFVDTDLEKAVKQTNRLVTAVESSDWTTMKSILDPNAALSVAGSFQVYTNRDQIIEGAKRAIERYGIKNVRVLSTDAERTDTLITITMQILSDHDATMGRTIPTIWQFEYQQTGNDWSLVRITNLKVGNLTGDRAADQFPGK